VTAGSPGRSREHRIAEEQAALRRVAVLGLKDRVEALGGRVSLQSPAGAGTTLQITLPLDGPIGQRWPAASRSMPSTEAPGRMARR
jgi:hypothetical protein